MPFIRDCVRRFRLDSEALDARQFITVRQGERIVAFGRIKPYGGDVYELGCVGVVEHQRGRGLGRLVVQSLIERFPADTVYVTTDVPEYFERLGFSRTNGLPPVLAAKIGRVEGKLRSGVVGMVYLRRRGRKNG
ncbi:MAG: GNAT family N-acetyltransferase [Chloroflexota bacterium]|nr:GNAT family N-acetyltransferase [Chloroflexota bacterium]